MVKGEEKEVEVVWGDNPSVGKYESGGVRDGHPGNTATARPPGHLPTIIAIKAGF